MALFEARPCVYNSSTNTWAGSGNWVALPNPISYTFNIAEIDADDAGRSDGGVMRRSVLATKRSLNLSWGPLTPVDMATILGVITPDTSTATTKLNTAFFELKYPDAKDNNTAATRIFYCGDRSSPAYSFNSSVAPTGQTNYVWSGLTVNFVER